MANLLQTLDYYFFLRLLLWVQNKKGCFVFLALSSQLSACYTILRMPVRMAATVVNYCRSMELIAEASPFHMKVKKLFTVGQRRTSPENQDDPSLRCPFMQVAGQPGGKSASLLSQSMQKSSRIGHGHLKGYN